MSRRLLLPLFFAPSLAFAQVDPQRTHVTAEPPIRSESDPVVRSEGSVTGTVHDSEGKPLARVGVTLEDASVFAGAPGAHRSAFALTDDEGHFRIPRINGGEFTLKVQALGFLEESRPLTVRVDKPTRVDIVLHSLAPLAKPAVTPPPAPPNEEKPKS